MIVRFPLVVAVAALTGLAGLAVAAAPIAIETPVPMIAPHAIAVAPDAALPGLSHALASAAAVEARAPVSMLAPNTAVNVVVVVTRAAESAPAAIAPDGSETPYLLLPDGFATLPAGASERFSSFSFVPLVPESAAVVPAPKLAPSLDVLDVTPATAPAAPRTTAEAPAAESLDVAAQHAYLAGAGPSAATLAMGGAAIGIVGLLGFALYHRIRPHATLENDTRKQIFQAVCDVPGLGVHTIAERARVSYSTATYHLERLIAAGMIVMTPDGNKLCYYKNGGAFTETERKILPLVKNEEAAKLLEAILDTPGTYRAALAERLGVTATTINWHLRRLREAGLIEETRQGRNAYLFVRSASAKESFLSLAAKVDETDAPVAERLRKFALFHPTSPMHGTSSGA